MKAADIKRLVKMARYRRDMRETSGGVDLCNGHWIVRIPTRFWPSDLAATTASRFDPKQDWDETGTVPVLEQVLASPWDTEHEPLPELVMHGRKVILQGNRGGLKHREQSLALYTLPDGAHVAFNAEYDDLIHALGFWIGQQTKPDAEKAFPIIGPGGLSVGTIMPVRLD